MRSSYHVLPPIIPNLENWPIYILSENRKQFVEEIERFTFNRIKTQKPETVEQQISETVYQERARIKAEPWRVDPPNDNLFWKKAGKRLFGKVVKNPNKQEKEETTNRIIKDIVHRYSEEIVGTFKISTFLFARRFLTLFFSRLLNVAANRNFARFFGRKSLHDKLRLYGNLEQIRGLFDKGTVIVVPTHFSNLDSILVGYAMDSVLGLPSFSYGAGLNLYNFGPAAYFMNRLGAYRVDRRKKNSIYLETLKAMSMLSIKKGVNSLFFPGGTRSRSGHLEKKLKMGLLGTAIEAQRALCQEQSDKKVFIVPLIISYHFVLEAKFLIDQHLAISGKEKYIKQPDDSLSFLRLLKFAWQFFSVKSEIVLSFGDPFDVLGNDVDKDGISYDQRGKKIDVSEYFISNGNVVQDLQREAEYTIMLSKKIVESYATENMVLSSHVVAFTAFRIFERINDEMDIYSLLRLPEEDFSIPYSIFSDIIGQVQRILLKMEKNNELRLSESLHQDVDVLIQDGLDYLGVYHTLKPLKKNKSGEIISEDFKVLYYYHNRLDSYSLEKEIQWKEVLHLKETNYKS